MKSGGLADRVLNSGAQEGVSCKFEEFSRMQHGWVTRGGEAPAQEHREDREAAIKHVIRFFDLQL